MKTRGSVRVLGIETSCDETAVSLIEVDAEGREMHILGDTVHSQIDVHTPYGGVFPTLAKREHQRNLVPVLEKTLEKAKMLESQDISNSPRLPLEVENILGRETELLDVFNRVIPTIKKPDIDYISVTIGPGLEPALWVGINFARALASVWNLPIVAANHMEGHILAALINKVMPGGHETDSYKLLSDEVDYPALSLLISGGHTQIVLVEREHSTGALSYRIVGETLDDAIGECFDKTARTLNLPYPGGPKVSGLAALARERGIKSPEPLPRPMIDSGDLNFSFSGLKTAVLYMTRRLKEKDAQSTIDEATRQGICREIEDAVTDVIVVKMKMAIERYAVGTLVVGGGVIANAHVRSALENLAKECSLRILLPEKDHSTDNGLMIALAGYLHRDKALGASTALKAMGTMSLGPRG